MFVKTCLRLIWPRYKVSVKGLAQNAYSFALVDNPTSGQTRDRYRKHALKHTRLRYDSKRMALTRTLTHVWGSSWGAFVATTCRER